MFTILDTWETSLIESITPQHHGGYVGGERMNSYTGSLCARYHSKYFPILSHLFPNLQNWYSSSVF